MTSLQSLADALDEAVKNRDKATQKLADLQAAFDATGDQKLWSKIVEAQDALRMHERLATVAVKHRDDAVNAEKLRVAQEAEDARQAAIAKNRKAGDELSAKLDKAAAAVVDCYAKYWPLLKESQALGAGDIFPFKHTLNAALNQALYSHPDPDLSGGMIQVA